MSQLLDWNALAEMGLLDARLALAMGVVAVGGFLRGFTGFGAALVIVPVLSLIFTPREGVAMHAVMELPGVLQLMPTAVRHADRKTVVPMILSLFIAMPLGAWLLVAIDQTIMRIVISTLVLLMVALLATNWRYEGPVRLPVSLSAGAAGGLIQGSAGVGGPPIVTILLSRDDPTDTARANIIAMMGSLILVALPTLWAYGLMTSRVLLVGIVAAPVYFSTIWIGSRYYAGRGKKLYRVVSLSMLALIAVATLVASLRG